MIREGDKNSIFIHGGFISKNEVKNSVVEIKPQSQEVIITDPPTEIKEESKVAAGSGFLFEDIFITIGGTRPPWVTVEEASLCSQICLF